MKRNIKDLSKCQKLLEVEVYKEAIQTEFDRYYENIQKTAQVPGFRKGKVPRSILEQRFADTAAEKVLTALINDNYHKAIQEEKIVPVELPQISNVNFKKEEKLTFQATIDVRPKFNLKDYKGLKIKKQSLAVKDEEINKILTFLQERYAQFLPVEKRPAKTEDYIICDFSYSVDGKVVEKKDNAWLAITEEMFIPGLSAQLQGMNLQDKKEFEIKLPKNFQPQELAQKTASFSFFVKEIKEKKLPELNDEFAKVMGKNSLAELKTLMKEDLIKEKEIQIKQDMKIQLIEQLVKAMPIDVPLATLKKREQLLKDAARQKLKQQGLNDEQIEKEEKQMTDVFEKEALKQVRMFFILEEISEKEKIKVEKEEVDKRIELIAQSYGRKPEEVLRHLEEKKLLENLHWELWEEKVIAVLLENAKIEEIASK